MGRRKQKGIKKQAAKPAARRVKGKTGKRKARGSGIISSKKIRGKKSVAIFIKKSKRNLRKTKSEIVEKINLKKISDVGKDKAYMKVTFVGKYRRYIGRSFAFSGKVTKEGIQRAIEKGLQLIFSKNSRYGLSKSEYAWKNYLTGIKFDFQ